LLVVAGGVALAAPDLLRIYSDTASGSPAVDISHAAGRAALLAALGVGVVWAMLTAGWELVGSRATAGNRAGTAGSWLLVVPVVLALAVAASSAHRIGRDVRDQWHVFTHLAGSSGAATSSSTSQPRLLSGAGNRYDYWRIAWRLWKEHPLLGVGAGNYPRPYYELRATTEDVEQPHSVELQALSELGVVGALLLAGSIAGVGWGAVRMRSRAAHAPLPRTLMVGGLGAFVAWLAQTSVDWMHLLPGLTAIAIAGAAVLVRPRPAAGARDATGLHQPQGSIGAAERPWARALTSRTARALGGSAVLATLVVAGASLSRQGLADFYRARAQHELKAHPEAAVTYANRSLSIDSDAVQTYYALAAALARFDQAAAAEAALRAALAREPDNFVTWTLLGDVAVRERRLGVAKRNYARAHQLNPQNSTLMKLTADPTGTLR
jgi:tetratricopeptide (TPR) repeat protein